MDGAKVHFEVFVRRNAKTGLTLELATEDHARALEFADEMMATGRACEVKVVKETMDSQNAFQSVTILTRGEPAKPQSKTPVEDSGPVCTAPADLYAAHARERIGRLLDGWLLRLRVTAFELLHRADLVERLEASGVELQHAMQKIAIPEAQERGVSVHEIIRRYQKLAEQAIERVLKDNRKGLFPNLAREGFAAAATRLADDPERAYLLGGGVADAVRSAGSWSEKVDRILDLADAAPTEPKARAVAFHVLEQLLSEILGARAGLAELLGSDLDLGGSLAAMTRMAAPEVVDQLAVADARVRDLVPALTGPAKRLSAWLGAPHFQSVQTAIARRVVVELNSPRRLRPSDGRGEIEIMRVLAMLLTATAVGGRVLQHDDVRDAFVYRSEGLLSSNFVNAYLAETATAMDELRALVWLAENVTGAANKRKAAQALAASIGGVRLEREMRESAEAATGKLIALADMQRSVRRAGLQEGDRDGLCVKIGEVGGLIEADARLIASVGRSPASPVHKLSVLLRYACGEAGPTGPAADRAKSEVLRLIKAPESRAALTESPEAFSKLRPMLQAIGLAA